MNTEKQKSDLNTIRSCFSPKSFRADARNLGQGAKVDPGQTVLPFQIARSSFGMIALLIVITASCATRESQYELSHGGIIRGDLASKEIALVFTGDEYADGGLIVAQTLRKTNTPASFFFTGRFYRNAEFSDVIELLRDDGHYLGAHSDAHLLYCTWENRDSLLVTRTEFTDDLASNYAEMARFGIEKSEALFFLPPYEWYNREIARWTADWGLTLINYSPGTRSHADYTTPDMGDRYVTSNRILDSILSFEEESEYGLNGFILLTHIGTHLARTDKLYLRLEGLIETLIERGYSFVRIDELLKDSGAPRLRGPGSP
jgi:peptidoglycan/xylan/chitin deacetylase (PgdA/CDA1 family)